MTKKLTTRLLNLFPVKYMADSFGTKSRSPKSEVVEEIVKTFSVDDISAWILDNFEISKHQVYIYETGKKIGSAPTGFALGSEAPVLAKKGEILFLLKLDYVTLFRRPDNTVGEVTLSFRWPVKVIFAGGTVFLKVTTMEKKPSAYLEHDQAFEKATRLLDERQIVASFQKALNGFSLTPLDLNTGTKAIWAADLVDSSAVEWIGSTSTKTERMHEKKFMKRDDPASYNEAIKWPLRKMLFEVIDQSITDLGSPFVVDPGAGTITFPTYHDDPKLACHVVGKILQNN